MDTQEDTNPRRLVESEEWGREKQGKVQMYM